VGWWWWWLPRTLPVISTCTRHGAGDVRAPRLTGSHLTPTHLFFERKEFLACIIRKKGEYFGCSCWSNNTSTSILQHHSKMAGGVSCVLLISTVDQQASEDFYIYATGCSQLEATKACQLPYKFLILQHGLTLFSN
jgi:hypothetical protein